MAIRLTPEEMQLVKEGKLNPNNILEHRKIHPVKTINLNEVEEVKQQIREAMVEYNFAIQKNKDLYNELAENRNKKAECRKKLVQLRKRKKELLGLIS